MDEMIGANSSQQTRLGSQLRTATLTTKAPGKATSGSGGPLGPRAEISGQVYLHILIFPRDNRTDSTHWLRMDPVTAIGVVGGSFQLVDVAARALIATIKGIRGIRNAPAQTAALLAEVERSSISISRISAALLQQGSSLFDKLTVEQFARLSPCALETRLAMESLQRLLSSLFDPSPSLSHRLPDFIGKDALRRTWHSVVSVYRQDEVSELLARVQRLNLNMVRELEVVGLEMQSELCDSSLEILAIIRESHGKVSSRLDNIQTCLAAEGISVAARLDTAGRASQDMLTSLGQAHTTTMSRLDVITSATSAIQSTAQHVVDQASSISDEIAAMRAEFNLLTNLVSDMRQDSRDTTHQLSQIQATTQGQSQVARIRAAEMRPDFSVLCDDIIRLLVGDMPAISTSTQNWVARLTAEESGNIASDVRRKLIRCPSALRDTHCNSQDALRLFKMCSCRPTSNQKELRTWRFRFFNASKSQHRPDCPLRTAGYRSWGYSMAVQLVPFLNRTVELTLGLTAGMGRWSVAPPLKYYGTVRRANSPLFRLFDELPEKCATEHSLISGSMVPAWRKVEGAPIAMAIEWDLEKTQEQLDGIIREIQEILTSKVSAGTDQDEDGNSLIFVRCQTDI
jgi:hypothetical protein